MPEDSITGSADYRTVADAFAAQVAERPDTPFLHHDNETYTYAEVDQRANTIANELSMRGVEAGDAVYILLYNSPEYLFTLFALAKLGAVAVPLDTRFDEGSLSLILSEVEADVIILSADTRTAYEETRARTPSIQSEYYVGPADDRHPYRPFEELLTGVPDTPPAADLDGSDPFTIIYVQDRASERAKGVVLPHFSYVNTGWECAHNLFEFSPSDCLFTTLPFYSSYPLQIGVVGAMLVGGAFAFDTQFEPETFWQQVHDYGATAFLYLDRMLPVLHDHGVDNVGADNPLEYAIGHGFGFDTDEALIDRFESAFDLTVLEGYGITATATVATFNRPGDRRVGSVGRPVSHAAIRIVDENDWPVETGRTGEIIVRSTRPNTMMSEYYGDPEATVDTCRNRWIHTNDIGYLDEDGYLYFVASKQNTIHRGRVAGRISSLEVESIIENHPDVAEAVVVGVANKRGEEEIKAAVVPREGANLTPAELCGHCEKRLTYLKIPRYIEIRESLPRSPTGNVRKDEIRNLNDRTTMWDREGGYELSR